MPPLAAHSPGVLTSPFKKGDCRNSRYDIEYANRETFMPNREDEQSVNERDLLRYCVTHKRYYDVKFGCQLCWLETHKRQEIHPLQKCPECNQVSLFYNTVANTYECLNLKCKQTFNEGELEAIKSSSEQLSIAQYSNPKAEPQAEPANAQEKPTSEESQSEPTEPFIKCPICLFDTLEWLPERNVYECQYDKCHGRTFTKEELEEIRRKRAEPTKGKGWFGNEYWDPKKKRWRKK